MMNYYDETCEYAKHTFYHNGSMVVVIYGWNVVTGRKHIKLQWKDYTLDERAPESIALDKSYLHQRTMIEWALDKIEDFEMQERRDARSDSHIYTGRGERDLTQKKEKAV